MLDARRLTEGASGRNSGFMIDLPHDLSPDDYAGKGLAADRRMIALNRMAIALARANVEEYGNNPAFFDPAGKINGAASIAGHHRNLSYASHLAALGEPGQMLDAKAMHEVTGSRHYISDLFMPGTVLRQPAGYVRSLGKGLRRDGGHVLECTPVQRFERTGVTWELTTPKGRVTAAKRSSALTTSSRSSWVCRWMFQLLAGASTYVTVRGCYGSRTSTIENPRDQGWPI